MEGEGEAQADVILLGFEGGTKVWSELVETDVWGQRALALLVLYPDCK